VVPLFIVAALIAALALTLAVSPGLDAQTSRPSSAVKLARLKYSGGGDWYNDPQGEVNLLNYISSNTQIHVDPVYEFVEAGTEKLFNYPLLFMTGHGNVKFSDAEIRNLRLYLENGGFLYADDDYGMDRAFRREMKRIFPSAEFVELPFSHGIYHSVFDFPNGPPKSHEHDNKSPQGFGIFHDGRLVVYYTFESNPSDAWNDTSVHGDPPAKREEALRFGTNVVVWALTN
jgi:hypothetical protein